MTGGPPSGTQVERVLEDLIARLSRAEPSKEVRAALIEARRLRSVTLTWTAIPPPPDARREMLTKVMDLISRVGTGAAPRSSAEVRAEAFASLSPPPAPPSSPGEIPSVGRSRPTTPPPPAAARRDGGRASPPTAPPPPFDEAPSRPSPLPDRGRTGDDVLALELGAALVDGRSRLPSPPQTPRLDASRAESSRTESPRPDAPPPFRRAPSAQAFAAARVPSITAVGHVDASLRTGNQAGRRAFGSGNGTQTNLSRPLRSSVNNGISLVRPQAAAWQSYPKVPGAKLKLLWRDADSGAYTALLHLAPGTTLPARRHAAVEEMLLVEGSALVGSWEMRPGEYSRAEAGSVHDPIRSDDGCTFFVTGSEHDELIEDPST